MLSITDARSFVVGSMLLASTVVQGCAAEEEGFAACDIRQADCQQRTFRAVAALRGGDTPMPNIRVVDPAGLMAHLMAGAEEMPAEEAAAEERAYRQWNRGLALFGLAPVDYGSEEAMSDRIGEIAGVYNHDSKEILIVDRGEPLDGEDAVLYLAHEFVHALQDAEHDLGAFVDEHADSFDSSLAITSIVEGEAVLYQALASAQLGGHDTRRLAWDVFFSRYQQNVWGQAEQDRAPVTMARVRFPYAFGGEYVAQRWLAEGREGVDALFAAPPRTTHSVLYDSATDLFASEQQRVRAAGVPLLDAGFEVVESTTLGAWIHRILVSRMDGAYDSEVARALTADWFSVQADDADRVVAAWRQHTADAAARTSWPGLRRPSVEYRFDPALRDYVLLAGDPAQDLDLASLTWQMPDRATDAESTGTATLRAESPAWRNVIACSVARAPRFE